MAGMAPVAGTSSTLLPPGGLFEIVFSFDTTGSMSRAIDEVKGRLQDMIQRLQADIPGIRIGLIAHGDYCDKDVFYLEKHLDLTTDVASLCELVKEVEGTGGGDPEECYEYILNMTSKFSWSPGSQRALVMIGDATPHGPDYELNVGKLDWREEAKRLNDMGVKIYGVQAFEEDDSTAFFEELVNLTSGQHLKLGDFSHICDFIMAICYRERGEEFLEGYEAEVRAREKRAALHKDLEGMFGALRRGNSSASNSSGAPPPAASVDKIDIDPLPRKLAKLSVDGTKQNKKVKFTPPRMKERNVVSIVLQVGKKGRRLQNSSKPKLTHGKTNRDKNNNSLKNKAGSKKTVNIKEKKDINNERKYTVTPKGKKKMYRHFVPDTKFVMKKGTLAKRWSSWKLIMSPNKPTNTDGWRMRNSFRGIGKDRHGWVRFGNLYRTRHEMIRCLYEFAVQTKSGGKMHVVYKSFGAIHVNHHNLDEKLLKRPYVQEMIEDILSKGYKLYMRRFVPKGLGKRQKQVYTEDFKNMYAYAWDNCTSPI